MILTDLIAVAGTLDYRDLLRARDHLQRAIWGTQAERDPAKDNYYRSRMRRLRLNWRGWPGGLSAQPMPLEAALDLPLTDCETLLATLRVLLVAKQPRAGVRRNADGEPIAGGYEEVKVQRKPLLVIDEETGIRMPAVDEDGNVVLREFHYLYLRVATSSPTGRPALASIYIGSLNTSNPRSAPLASFLAAYLDEDDETVSQATVVRAFIEGGHEAVSEIKERYRA